MIDALDGRLGDHSNLHRVTVGWQNNPIEKVQFTTDYNALFADAHPTTAGTGGLAEDGSFRGHLITAQIKHNLSDRIQHRVNGEFFVPGDFYTDQRNDPVAWLRYEIVFSW